MGANFETLNAESSHPLAARGGNRHELAPLSVQFSVSADGGNQYRATNEQRHGDTFRLDIYRHYRNSRVLVKLVYLYYIRGCFLIKG